MRSRIITLTLVPWLLGGLHSGESPQMEGVSLTASERRRALDDLRAFLAIPNDVADPVALEHNVAYLLRRFRDQGIHAERLEAGGAPYVFAEYRVDPALPTVLVYSHFDGVPVEQGRWSSPPFEPTLRSGGVGSRRLRADDRIPDTARLYGRSVADSKNSITALLTALRRVRRDGEPAVNLKFLFDGEEERESPTLGRLLERYADPLAADLLVSASGEVHQSGLPTAAFGVRGVITFELTVHTAVSDLHSGHFGNLAPNAALRLSGLLASLKHDDGRVVIPGFYDDVQPLTESERALIAAVPAIESEVRDLFGIASPEIRGASLQELINLPTLNIRGLSAGYVGAAARNIIPTRATASLDVRLVAAQRPGEIERQLRDWLASEGWTVVNAAPDIELLRARDRVIEVHTGEGFPATKSPATGRFADYVVNAVRSAAWSPEVVIEPTEGGSLKHHIFTDRGMAYVALPTSNFDNNQHTHDENLELRYFWYGIRLFETLMRTRPE